MSDGEDRPAITETMRRLLGARADLIDQPLRLRNSPPVHPGWMTDWWKDGEPTAVERAAIERDAYCCRFCGFVFRQHQRVVALDGWRRDVDRAVTACAFCHQCLHLEQVAGMESGVLIWAPEMTQAGLSHIAPEICVGRVLGRTFRTH